MKKVMSAKEYRELTKRGRGKKSPSSHPKHVYNGIVMQSEWEIEYAKL
jgi:hypothetical protein